MRRNHKNDIIMVFNDFLTCRSVFDIFYYEFVDDSIVGYIWDEEEISVAEIKKMNRVLSN